MAGAATLSVVVTSPVGYLTRLERCGVIRKVKKKMRSRHAHKRRPPVYVWFGIAPAKVAG